MIRIDMPNEIFLENVYMIPDVKCKLWIREYKRGNMADEKNIQWRQRIQCTALPKRIGKTSEAVASRHFSYTEI